VRWDPGIVLGLWLYSHRSQSAETAKPLNRHKDPMETICLAFLRFGGSPTKAHIVAARSIAVLAHAEIRGSDGEWYSLGENLIAQEW